jgi:uncharacterized protein (UPF0335 family)
MTFVANKTADMQPDELKTLKETVREFMERLNTIDNEVELLKADRKQLLEDFSNKLDMKTLKAVLRIVNIKKGVSHKDTFDTFMEILDSDPDA